MFVSAAYPHGTMSSDCPTRPEYERDVNVEWTVARAWWEAVSRSAEREKALRAAATLGWTYVPPSKGSPYGKLKCGCGKHITWLHKTPSNPNYYRERVQYMRRTCDRSKR